MWTFVRTNVPYGNVYRVYDSAQEAEHLPELRCFLFVSRAFASRRADADVHQSRFQQARGRAPIAIALAPSFALHFPVRVSRQGKQQPAAAI
jgi:hypothetical protein